MFTVWAKRGRSRGPMTALTSFGLSAADPVGDATVRHSFPASGQKRWVRVRGIMAHFGMPDIKPAWLKLRHGIHPSHCSLAMAGGLE